MLAAEGRQQLLVPVRKPVHLRNVDVPTAIQEIQKVFPWVLDDGLSEDDEEFVKDIRVSIDRDRGSLAEVLADLCSQTGLHIFEDLGSISIGGAIGYEETGRRNFAFGTNGILFLLDAHEIIEEGRSTFLLYPSVRSHIPWLHLDDSRFRIDELAYPDGTRLGPFKEESFVSDIPMAPLAANKGRIQKIKGELFVQLPVKVIRRDIPIVKKRIPYEVMSDDHYMKIVGLIKTNTGWKLSIEYGNLSKDQPSESLPSAHVDALGWHGKPLKGFIWSIGQGSSNIGLNDPYGWRESWTLEAEYQELPRTVRWTYVKEGERHCIPFQLIDCRVPDIIWDPSRARKTQLPAGSDSSIRSEADLGTPPQ